MIDHMLLPSTRRVVVAIALLAASLIGAGSFHAVPPTPVLVAECLSGQVVDPATGICPDAPLVNGSADLESNPAVQDAQQASEADESLAGSN